MSTKKSKHTKNKIVVFANIKGGTGKSCLTAVFASYLYELGIPVMVVDADIQQTIARHRQRDLGEQPEQTVPWSIESLDMSDTEYVKRAIDALVKLPACIVIDCPGNITDPALKYVFASADIAVTPMRYDSDNIDATLMFAKVFKQVSKAKMFFLPNSIALVEERRDEVQKARDAAKSVLEPYGDVNARIKQSVVIKCYSTINPLDRFQHNAVMHSFDPIVKLITQTNNEEENR